MVYLTSALFSITFQKTAPFPQKPFQPPRNSGLPTAPSFLKPATSTLAALGGSSKPQSLKHFKLNLPTIEIYTGHLGFREGMFF